MINDKPELQAVKHLSKKRDKDEISTDMVERQARDGDGLLVKNGVVENKRCGIMSTYALVTSVLLQNIKYEMELVPVDSRSEFLEYTASPPKSTKIWSMVYTMHLWRSVSSSGFSRVSVTSRPHSASPYLSMLHTPKLACLCTAPFHWHCNEVVKTCDSSAVDDDSLLPAKIQHLNELSPFIKRNSVADPVQPPLPLKYALKPRAVKHGPTVISSMVAAALSAEVAADKFQDQQLGYLHQYLPNKMLAGGASGLSSLCPAITWWPTMHIAPRIPLSRISQELPVDISTSLTAVRPVKHGKHTPERLLTARLEPEKTALDFPQSPGQSAFYNLNS
ncbi:uncharacterized protein PHACADRAFT_27161 [Phanerochaete carnosa HHB-10118-sp]|uniref:Uncharacterized protein n=1 Tax=Phanerochaete carnosa (strain HHB-10118-sp) TaxID=650164 RepID=K5WHE0_PHACS|nr:uncharacterized protein PHACADRAFT_27161 [Phanerochaete carnosa HHB-10118-sp]EKM58745.1 hypothetical protein PHACADRAFT_27161 [Phanerochaete carnosa HHB-10118-sp]